MEKPIREIYAFKDYFEEFNATLPLNVQRKIEFIFDIIRFTQRVPEKFLKHIEGSKGLYEIRIEVGSNIFRIFSFFDEGKLVVVLNGFQKKSQKTPKNEIKLAEDLMKEYFEIKRLKNGK
ncbi:MAG: type II toxin-antitoxin system RelE/ParE family toxin [Spirosomaceae bacterium]|jgi:phage-related protein|nr:type II toxin-antitoxin system RelE/ParE family toxin [Spirosomataceae bacterium]